MSTRDRVHEHANKNLVKWIRIDRQYVWKLHQLQLAVFGRDAHGGRVYMFRLPFGARKLLRLHPAVGRVVVVIAAIKNTIAVTNEGTKVCSIC